MDIIDVINNIECINKPKAASEQAIIQAEIELSLSFSEEYKKYLSNKGFMVYDGHELTGICKAKRLNVVDVTKTEKQITHDIPDNWYVIEQVNIDGIVIWQSTEGVIYQTSPNAEPIKICNSFAEYISI